MDLSKSVEVEVDLSFFKARPYQEDFFNALDEGWTRIFYLAARRTGKDYAAWYWCIEEACLRGPVFILYCLPTYTLARAVVFEGRDLSGQRFLDMIPKAAVESINISTMRITFKNGSMIWLVGANDFKTRLVGINPSIMIFSEWARFEDGGSAWDFASPILAAHGSKGRAIFLTTPYGKNFAFHMWEMAQNLKDWKCIKKTIEDCGHISQNEIEKERAMKSPELFAQEFLCSFSRGVQGAVFSRELNKIRDNGQITTIEYSAEHEVNVAIDIGMRDATCMVFFQVIGAGSIVRIIDFEAFTGEGLTRLAAIIQAKPYKYNKFFAPHDLEVREWTRGGITRKQLASQMGLEFHVLPKLSILDSIEISRVAFPKLWIDSRKCARLVDAMENYYREWDDTLQTYKGNPIHNWASDACFVGETLVLTRSGMCQIMDIKQDTEVLTLSGWKKCSQARLIQRNAPLVEIIFQDNTTVKCTPDHLFLTEKGWKSAEKLMPYSKIQSALMQSPSTSMENFIGSMKIKDILEEELQLCTEMFGVRPSVKSPAVATYITKIIKQLTIIYGTLSAYLPKNILGAHILTTKGSATRREKQPLNGINLQRGDYGTKGMLSEVRAGNFGRENQSIAYGAIKNLWLSSEEMGQAHKNFVTTTANLPFIEKIKKLNETADVYCITVPDAGHFALSNGAIVKNCDSFRYMCQSLDLCQKGMSPESFNEIKQKALRGSMTNPIPYNIRNPW